MNKLIGLTGYARAGKDVLADHLVARGFVRYNFGDTIKTFFAPFIGGQEDWIDLMQRVTAHRSNRPSITDERLMAFARTHLIPYSLSGKCLSAFTEITEDKARFRGILEEGGELVYDHLIAIYIEGLERLLASGARVVNTRVGFNTKDGDSPEAEAMKRLGGTIIEIVRDGHPPASPWDHEAVEGLRGLGVLDMQLRNAAASGEEWAHDAELFVEGLLAPLYSDVV